MAKHSMEWEPLALERLKKAPFFIRGIAKKKVEQAAREQGATKVTLELFEQIKQREMGGKTPGR